MPALCVGLQCHYGYYDGAGVITGFTWDSSTLALVITGTDLGTPTEITMGRIACSNIVASLTQINCDLASDLPAGSWLPIVIEDHGKVVVDGSVSPEVVTMVISDVQPNTDINPAGGQTLTITGDKFPPTNDALYGLAVDLGAYARCVVLTTSTTEITCLTEPFDISRRRRRLSITTFDLTVSVTDDSDGVASATFTAIEIRENPLQATAVTPSTVSPIAFRTIEI